MLIGKKLRKEDVCEVMMECCDSVRRKGKFLKDYMEGIISEENYWDHDVHGDAPGCIEKPINFQMYHLC